MSLDARVLLQKFGWKEGDGLGKERDGIKEAIKPKFQQDTSGLGVDKAAALTAPWWADVYNTTAQKISVDIRNNEDSSDSEEEKPAIKRANKSKKQTDLTSEEPRSNVEESAGDKGFPRSSVNEIVNKSRQASYGNFVKAVETTDEVHANEDTQNVKKNEEWTTKKEKKRKFPIDEDVLHQCEGLTAHKGARHGITMGGKMKRVLQQEKGWLQTKRS